ncbi:hypothetical protein CL614_00765 [archaeon]|nr:hypothetical protein [archaeon]
MNYKEMSVLAVTLLDLEDADGDPITVGHEISPAHEALGVIMVGLQTEDHDGDSEKARVLRLQRFLRTAELFRVVPMPVLTEATLDGHRQLAIDFAAAIIEKIMKK